MNITLKISESFHPPLLLSISDDIVQVTRLQKTTTLPISKDDSIKLMDLVNSIYIPKTTNEIGLMGVDGTSYELEIIDKSKSLAIDLSWWSSPLNSWVGIRELVSFLISLMSIKDY